MCSCNSSTIDISSSGRRHNSSCRCGAVLGENVQTEMAYVRSRDEMGSMDCFAMLRGLEKRLSGLDVQDSSGEYINCRSAIRESPLAALVETFGVEVMSSVWRRRAANTLPWLLLKTSLDHPLLVPGCMCRAHTYTQDQDVFARRTKSASRRMKRKSPVLDHGCHICP